jgi:hypothetical protein
MLICPAENCAKCAWEEGSAGCLRRQAELCTELSKQVLSRGLHEALEELGRELMKEACNSDTSRGSAQHHPPDHPTRRRTM